MKFLSLMIVIASISFGSTAKAETALEFGSYCRPFEKPKMQGDKVFIKNTYELVLLSVQKRPFPAPGGFGSHASVMGLQTLIQVRGPAAICPIGGADDVDEAWHCLIWP